MSWIAIFSYPKPYTLSPSSTHLCRFKPLAQHRIGIVDDDESVFVDGLDKIAQLAQLFAVDDGKDGLASAVQIQGTRF